MGSSIAVLPAGAPSTHMSDKIEKVICTTRTKEHGDRTDEEEPGTAGNGRVDGEINEAADTGDERLEA